MALDTNQYRTQAQFRVNQLLDARIDPAVKRHVGEVALGLVANLCDEVDRMRREYDSLLSSSLRGASERLEAEAEVARLRKVTDAAVYHIATRKAWDAYLDDPFADENGVDGFAITNEMDEAERRLRAALEALSTTETPR